MHGWIVNLDHPEGTYPTYRQQEPCLYLDDGTPVFEVWLWHSLLRRWFVMAMNSDPQMQAQGVVYFFPGQREQLRSMMRAMENEAGIYRL